MAPQRNTGAGAEAELPEYAGHYRLESRLGSGGMGVVHLARSTSGLKLAVKVVHAEFARDPEFRGRFRQEVAAARRVSGAFTAPVVDADPEAERPWMATLFIPGPTLAEQVKQDGPLAGFQLRRLMAGLAEGLRDIHRAGVVHRDLKPSNVLLADDGPKVIDFGISRPSDSELRTETGKLIGTPPFMAPEQFRSPREVGPAADIFALGSVLVHAATGRGPFDSDSPYVVAYQVVHDEPDLTGVPDDLVPLVLRCLAKEPKDRPAPDELMRELRSVAASYDTQAFIPAQRSWANPSTDTTPEAAGDEEPEAAEAAKPEPTGETEAAHDPERPAGRRRRRRVLLGAGALGLALAGTLVAGELWGAERPPPKSTVSHTAPAGFQPWQEKTATGTSGFAYCSYGAGKLLCARSGLVFALDPDHGGLLWRHSVTRTVRSGPPMVSGGLVQPALGQTRGLHALSPASGKPVWRQDRVTYRSIALSAGVLLLTGANGTVTAVDGASGETRWSRAIPGHQAPIFQTFPGDPLAYATSTSGDSARTRVTAVDPKTGKVRWDARLTGSLRPVGTANGSLVLVSVDAVYQAAEAVVRYTPGTGKARRVPLPVRMEQPEGTVRGDIAYLTGADGRLVAVDLAERRQLWSVETGATRTSRPVTDGRYVYVTAPDGRLLGVDGRDGRLVGQTPARLGDASDRVPPAVPQPVIAGGRVYACAPDGTVFAVAARDPKSW